MSWCLRTLMVMAALTFSAAAVADDAYYNVRLNDLKLTEAAMPTTWERPNWRTRQRTEAMWPYAVLDGEGEVYVDFGGGRRFNVWSAPTQLAERGSVAICAPEGQDVSGHLFVPKADWSGIVMLKFTVPASEANRGARSQFYRAKESYYQELLGRSISGAAWFRRQARQARIASHRATTGSPRRFAGPTRGRTNELAQTYALFTGGRAMSENLQLDRVLPETKPDEPTVEVDSIEGITVREFDWKELTKDLKPKPDPLAAMIPADQHVVFFPTVTDAITAADQLTEKGTVLLRLAEPRSENARTIERYEGQFCLWLDGLVRLLGPHVARSVALTGSDPYFRTGTDVALLVEAPKPALLKNLLFAQVSLAAAKNKEAKLVQGEVGGLAYHGVRSGDRSVCSYVAKLDGAVVVTNSLYQLGRLASVRQGESDSIAMLPEYTFFRSRYPVGGEEETAFLFLSDATIRRWCGPRWRITTSRRTRDAAVMAEIQAAQLDRLVKNTVTAGPIYTDLPTADVGELTVGATGIRSSVHGTLGFMTPIAELSMDRVTQAEAEGYRRWRDGYQRNWTVSFDPIGLRLSVRPDKLSADLTVMPLIMATRYRGFVSISQGAKIAPRAGDPHDALVHFILAVNKKAPMFERGTNSVEQLAKGVTLGWLGESVAIYADDDPFWQDLAKVPPDEVIDFLEKEVGRIPVALHAEVSNGFQLTMFLTALRAFIEQSAPGMTVWESLTYKDEPYVKVSPSERAKGREEELENLAVYYSASGDSLVVTLSESVLKRVLDRQLARRAAKKEGKKVPPVGKPWLGSNLGFRADGRVLQIVSGFASEQYQAVMQARAWGNLPILNEWKRRYPDEDPLDLHERIWKTRLVCPGGGTYVWNEQWQTMESTVYGHPGQPKQGPHVPPALTALRSGDFGLSFEHEGLRAQVVLGLVTE